VIKTSRPLPAELHTPWRALNQRMKTGVPRMVKTVVSFPFTATAWTIRQFRLAVTDPARFRQNAAHLWAEVKHEADHYYVGSKLMAAETKVAVKLWKKKNRGVKLTRREDYQLRRCMSDLIRMIPFIVITIIPAAELALPLLLKLFPNMLPTPYAKSEQQAENFRKSLTIKLKLHTVLQGVLQDQIEAAGALGAGAGPARQAQFSSAAGVGAANPGAGGGKAKKGAKEALTAEQITGMLDDMRTGKEMAMENVVKIARMFTDDVTLDNLPRGQLAAVAKYCDISPFLPEVLMRMQIRSRLSSLKADDRSMYKDGTDSMPLEELREACEARGMPVEDLDTPSLRRQLDEWLALSVKRDIPMTLLLLSRSFAMSAAEEGTASASGAPAGSSLQILQEGLSSMGKDVVEEVVQAAPATAPAPAAAAAPTAAVAPAPAGGASPAAAGTAPASAAATAKAATPAAPKDAAPAPAPATAAPGVAGAAPTAAPTPAAAAAAPTEAEQKAAAAEEEAAVEAASVSGLDDADAAATSLAPEMAELEAAGSKLKVDLARSWLEEGRIAPDGALGKQTGAAAAEDGASGASSVASAAGAGKAREDADAADAPSAAAIEEKEQETLQRLEELEKAKKVVMEATISAADVDKDGSLDRAEVEAVVSSLLPNVDPAKATDEVMRFLDTDRDGEVSADSLADRLASSIKSAGARLSAREQRQEDEEDDAAAAAQRAEEEAAATPKA
jgi:LETM1 and EF-hand domain-containing protein 1